MNCDAVGRRLGVVSHAALNTRDNLQSLLGNAGRIPWRTTTLSIAGSSTHVYRWPAKIMHQQVMAAEKMSAFRRSKTDV
eukprot:197466-Rhodomonas_salina.2